MMVMATTRTGWYFGPHREKEGSYYTIKNMVTCEIEPVTITNNGTEDYFCLINLYTNQPVLFKWEL